MGSIACIPTWPVDGPPPSPPRYSLVSSSRLIVETDTGDGDTGAGLVGIDRFLATIKLYGYPPDKAAGWNAFREGSSVATKGVGTPPPTPQFQPVTLYLAESCSTFGIWGGGLSEEEAQARFAGRAEAAMAAVESEALAREFMGGAVMGNPYLANGATNDTDHFPVGDTVEGFVSAAGILENAIQELTGRAGVLHCSPRFAICLSSRNMLWRDPRGPGGNEVLRTINGTLVVPDGGYVGESQPDSHAAPTSDQEWIYATGPVEVRRSQTILLPNTVREAVDRADNTITYRVERYYTASWDTELQAAVLADLTTEF